MPLDTCPTLVPCVNSCLFEWEKMLTAQMLKIDLYPRERIIEYSDPSYYKQKCKSVALSVTHMRPYINV